MLKKILITLFILPVIGAAIYGYFHFKQIKTPLSSVIKAIPSNAAVILKCNTPKSSIAYFSLTNPMWKSLVTYPFFGEIHTDMHYLDALFSNNKEAYKNILDKPLFISAHPDASNHFGLLYLLNLPNTVTKKQVTEFIQNAAPKTASYNLRIYDGVALNELKFTETKTLYFFFNKGIFACTFSSFLMEDAITQLNSGTPISDDPAFDKIWNSAGKKVEATLFLNFNYFPQMLANMLEAKEANFLKPLTTFANWSSLDIKTKNSTYQLSGFTLSKDSTNNYLNIFKDQEPEEIEITEEIPAYSAYFQCITLSDVNRYFKNYNTYLNNLTDHYTRQEQLAQVNKKYGINSELFFRQWMGKQFAYVITEPETENYEQNCYAIFKTNGTKEVDQLLLDFKEKINKTATTKDSISEKFRGYNIEHINVESLIPLVFGEGFEKIKNTFYVKINESLVFANSTSALKKWISVILSGNTLSEDADYKLFAENISNTSSIYIYSALGRSSQLFRHSFKKAVLNWNDSKTETLQNFHALALQLSANQSLFYSNVFAEYKPCYKKASPSIFETELDTTIQRKPSPLIDPNDSSLKIFVQDDANTIYLLNENGKIVWKRALKEKIMSEVQSVNSKKDMQLLFSTKTKIYVLDNAGENVGKFPIVLKYAATNGVKAVDYDHTGDYRLLIAEENKRIYNYTMRGEAVNGWEAVANADKVRSPIQNFRAKGLDYLVILDQSGTLNLLDRKGKSVVKFKQKLKNLYRDSYFLDVQSTLNSSSVLTCDSTGLVSRLYFSGTLEKSQVIKSNQPFYFSYIPEAKKMVFLSKNKLEFFDAKNSKLTEVKLKLNSLLEPGILLTTGQDFELSIACLGESIRLFSSDGIQLNTFKTAVSSAPLGCQLFGDNSWYTVIGAGKKIAVYEAF